MASQSNYEDIAVAIADVILSLSHDQGLNDGKARFEHFCENNMNAPCDMLARLGIMTEARAGMEHCFTSDWRTGMSHPVQRHQGEPSLDDLFLALKFYSEWFPKVVSKDSFQIAGDRPALPNFSGPYANESRTQFHHWAMQNVIELLLKANLGNWAEDGRFKLFKPFDEHRGLEKYWMTRSMMAKNLASGENGLYPSN